MALEAGINKRRWIKGQATRYENILSNHAEEDIQVSAIELYLSKLRQHSSNLETTHEVINNLCNAEEVDQNDEEFNGIIERLEASIITFQSMLSQKSQSNRVRQTAEIKLPKMELPVFGGNYTEWLSFHDLFKATVHDNSALSAGQKFQYLKSSLRNEAALLIHSIPVTDDNYPEAWDILINRYNNTREIIDAHIQRLFNQPSITNESSSDLRRLIDTTAECVRALKVLKEPVQHWDSILVHLVKEKLDQESRRQWELSLKGIARPKYAELSTFIDQRARALSVAETSMTVARSKPSAIFPIKKVHHIDTSQEKCVMCGGAHPIFACSRFRAASTQERWNIVQKHSMCFNCFKTDHRSNNCKSGKCRRCSAKHNTLLHEDGKHSNINNQVFPTVEAKKAMTSKVATGVLLATAVVQVVDYEGQAHPVRALLDSGSEASFITERCAQGLKLARKQVNVTISGIGGNGAGSSHSVTTLSVLSRLNKSVQLTVEAFVLRRLTGRLPSNTVNPKNWSHLKNLQLADPTFYKAGDIDILLGADVFVDVIRDGHQKGPRGLPSAFKTVFGWAISGPVGKIENEQVSIHHCHLLEDIQKLWELEEFPRRKVLTTTEAECEEHFKITHIRDESGRYTVRLPFRSTNKQLGNSRDVAMRQFLQTERRLHSNPKLYDQYRQFMDEYLTLGHMELIPETSKNKDAGTKFYLPHHGVLKEASTTTKLRVVFNASVTTSNGRSLNDTLLVGPELQDDLVNLLIRFRLPVIAITADLAKMYRQIRIHPEDSDYQRIFWRRRMNLFKNTVC